MRAKASATAAEIPTRFRDCPGRDSKGFRFGSDVEHPDHLTILETFIRGCLADSNDEIARRLSSFRRRLIMIMLDAGCGSGARTQFLICKFAEVDAEQRKRRVGSRVRRKIEPGNLRIKKIRLCWFLWALQKFFAVDDLDDAARTGAIAEVHAIALRSGGHGSM